MNFADILFLEVEDVVEAHALALAKDGGDEGIRDAGLLESAVMAPQSSYPVFLSDVAAAYAHGLANNHAFVDGNKRTGLMVALLFLEINGYALHLRDDWKNIMLLVADAKMTRDELSSLFANEMPGGDGVALISL